MCIDACLCVLYRPLRARASNNKKKKTAGGKSSIEGGGGTMAGWGLRNDTNWILYGIGNIRVREWDITH